MTSSSKPDDLLAVALSTTISGRRLGHPSSGAERVERARVMDQLAEGRYCDRALVVVPWLAGRADRRIRERLPSVRARPRLRV